MTKDNSYAMFTPEPKNNRRAILIVVLGLIVISACYFYITSNYKVSSSDKSSKVDGYITNLKNIKPDALWTKIHEADKKHWVMAAAC